MSGTTMETERKDLRSRFIDPSTLMRIKNLQVRAKVVVQGFVTGLHRSPYHGFSVEFSEYREYSPGDDPRYLDWRLFARTDRYYIKRFEDETNVRCYLVVDNSRSMGYSSIGYSKAEYARTSAATLAYFLLSQRDAVGLLTFADKVDRYVPCRSRPGHLARVLHALEQDPVGNDTSLTAPLEQIAATVNKRGLIVLISDLLAPADGLAARLSFLRSRGHEVVVFRVLDPAELNFDFGESAMFHDVETGRELYVDPIEAKRQYLQRFQEHADQVSEACASMGIDHHIVSTDRPLELTLYDYLSDRLRRGRFASGAAMRRSRPGQRSGS